jgi:hypothetical protein
MKARTSTHYWTGRGTLCSLDNSAKQKANHVTHWPAVNCRYCLYQHELNVKKVAP